MLGEAEKQFSFTRLALITCGHRESKSTIPSARGDARWFFSNPET
jgi:hypothetical protein